MLHICKKKKTVAVHQWLLIISWCGLFWSIYYTIWRNMSVEFLIGITLDIKQMHILSFFFQDVSFTDDQCFYFMFPVRGGAFNSVNKKIRKHEITPSVSSERICIRPCVRGTCRCLMETENLCGFFKWKQFGDLEIVPLGVLCYRDPLTGVSLGCLSHCSWQLFLMACMPLHIAVIELVPFEQVSHRCWQ